MVEMFAGRSAEMGRPLNLETMQSMIQWFCGRRSCHRPLTGSHVLALEGVGNHTVRAFQEPAAMVESFSNRASEAGHPMNSETMHDMLDYFCRRRTCFRPITPPWTLELQGVGNVTVMPHEEPAYKVEVFAAAAFRAGVDMNVETMQSMLEFFCKRRSCHRPLTGALKLEVEPFGDLVVQPFQEPAEARVGKG